MATFRKRGNKWSFRIDLGRDPVTNERRQPTVSHTTEYPKGFSTKKEAQTAAATMQHEFERGTLVKEKDILFKDLITDWMNTYSKGVKPGTVRVRKHESGHLISFFEFTKARSITKKMYQDALNKFKETLADNTVDGIHSTGRMIFKHAMKFDYIKMDPTQYAKVPKAKKTVEQIENNVEVPKYLEKEQLSLFLKTAQEKGLEGDYFIFLLLAYSGIRDGELCAIKKTDFDDKEHTLSITKTYYNPNNNIVKFELGTPKTKTSIRKIKLEEIIFDELTSHIAKQNEVKMMYRKTYYDKGFVFVSHDKHPGYPIYIKKIENRMSRLLKLAGLDENLTPHSLRHTHTSLLAEAGVSLPEIMERLGHKDDETTKSVYLHVTKTMKKEASHKFGQLMKNL